MEAIHYLPCTDEETESQSPRGHFKGILSPQATMVITLPFTWKSLAQGEEANSYNLHICNSCHVQGVVTKILQKDQLLRFSTKIIRGQCAAVVVVCF